MPAEQVEATAPPTASPKKLRFSEIDGLRAIACALVISFHTSSVFEGVSSYIPEQLVKFKVTGGIMGVYIFFAISGYIIPISLRGKRIPGLKRFGVQRFWRLYPPFWISLSFLYLGNLHKYTSSQLIIGATMLPSIWGTQLIGDYFWTLEIELLFYVIISTAFIIFGQLRGRLTMALFLLILAWCWLNPPNVGGYQVRPANELALIFWGACCRLFTQKRRTWDLARAQISVRAMSIGIVTGLMLLWPLQGAYFSFSSGKAYYVESAMAMIVAIFLFLIWVVLVPVRIRWLAHIGRWTYSTYLFHGVILYAVLEKFTKELAGWPLPVYIIGTLMLSFCLGGIAYRYLEQPSDRIGKRLSSEAMRPTG